MNVLVLALTVNEFIRDTMTIYFPLKYACEFCEIAIKMEQQQQQQWATVE